MGKLIELCVYMKHIYSKATAGIPGTITTHTCFSQALVDRCSTEAFVVNKEEVTEYQL